MALVAYGVQDIYSSSNKEIVYFKVCNREKSTSSKPINLHIDDNSVKVWRDGYHEVVSRSEYESMKLQNDNIMINHNGYSEVLSRLEYIKMKGG